MNVCIIVDDYMPDSIKVAAKMMHELACKFLSQGHSVTVITPNSNIKNSTKEIELDGVKVLYFKSGEIKNIGKIKRAINETLLSVFAYIRLKKHIKRNKYDYIIYYSPTIFWGLLVKRLKKEWSAKSYLVLRDFFPQWAIDQEIIKKGTLIEKYFRYFEKINYQAADIIGVMSKKNLEWFMEQNLSTCKVEILHNWANNKSTENRGIYRKKLNLKDKIVMFYGGNMGKAQDMMNIVRLAKRLKIRRDVHFILVGAGDEVELIKNEINNYNLKNITLLPPVTQSEYKELLAECDIGLFSLHKEHRTHNFPGKLLGYMAQGIPILGSVNSGNDIIDILDKNAGYISVNGDDDSFYQNAIRLLDKDEREKLGTMAQELLDTHFSTKSAIDTILNSFIQNHPIKNSLKK